VVILEKKVAGLTEASLSRFVLRARRAIGLKGTMNVLVTSNAAMSSLNLRFRRKNKPTDVLSFPSAESKRKTSRSAGEIAISAEIAEQNASWLGHPAAAEVKVLVLHGMLHLAGFDHERDDGAMARKEARLRRELRLPSALIERGRATGTRPRASHLQKQRQA
jgi:probable rRNA maturation factor